MCEFSSLRLDHTTTNTFKISLDSILRFELYDDEERHQGEEEHSDNGQHHGHHCGKILNIIKPIFSSGTKKYNDSSKMRLEISVHDYNKPTLKSADQFHHKNPTPVMETEAISGTKLLFVLNEWQNQLNLEQRKKSYDYEL
jgi:hypothetical protein